MTTAEYGMGRSTPIKRNEGRVGGKDDRRCGVAASAYVFRIDWLSKAENARGNHRSMQWRPTVCILPLIANPAFRYFLLFDLFPKP